jgi:hypothetical protein
MYGSAGCSGAPDTRDRFKILANGGIVVRQSGVHDVEAVNISLASDVVFEGWEIEFNVTARNDGDFTERFNVSTYANKTGADSVFIDAYLVTSLGSTDQITIPFVWNTLRAPTGNYTITAETSVVDGETETANNIKTAVLWVKPDNTCPVISVPIQEPPGNELWLAQSLQVRWLVWDSESGLANTTLQYRVENNTSYDNKTWYNVTAYLSWRQGWDSSYYDANLGGFGPGTVVYYRIIAYDLAGNIAVRDHGGASYSVYIFIPEFPSLLIMPLFFIATLLAVIVYRKNQADRR